MYKNSNRQGNVEIMRFVASIIVMTFHLSYIGIERGNYPFSQGWIWVEFFLALMGYFVVVHFSKNEVLTIDEKAQASITYTIKRWIRFFPYVFISSTMYSLLEKSPLTNRYGVAEWVEYFYDITLLTGGFKGQRFMNAPLWFLSAILIIFPLFTLICQIKSKKLLVIISFYVTVMFYGYFNEIEYTRFPMNILRALVGLCLGVLVYALVNYIKNLKLSTRTKVIYTIIEVGIFMFVILATYKNKSFHQFIILCFVVGLSIMLSKQSYTSKLDGRIIQWCGKISMTIYIFHPVVGTFIMHYWPDMSIEKRCLLYYTGTIIVSSVLYYVIEKIRITIQKRTK